jgi:hypothetical protein
MKKILLILILSIGLASCSSIKFEDIATPDSETSRILALDLTHEENLSEASKISDSHMSAVITGKLKRVEDQKNKAAIEAVSVNQYAENVKVTDGDFEIKFEGSEISKSKKVGMLDEYEYQDYFIKGLKDKKTGLIQHQLYLKIKYTWSQRKNYSSASFCDKWQGCENADKLDITLISSSASSCTTNACDYSEIMELNLSDDYLRSKMVDGFSVSFNSKKSTNEITIASDYLKGYLKVAN